MRMRSRVRRTEKAERNIHMMPDLTQPEYNWMRQPLTLDEFMKFANRNIQGSGCLGFRDGPQGQYTIQPLLYLLIADYARLKYGIQIYEGL